MNCTVVVLVSVLYSRLEGIFEYLMRLAFHFHLFSR
jgi:hypothetical protein